MGPGGRGAVALSVAAADLTAISTSPAPTVLVSLATYNEVGHLADLVAEIRRFAPSADVLIIDDNSPDGTGRLADELVARHSGVHVLHRGGKLGLGTAIVAGMRFALAHGYDYFLNMDADFSHPPRYIPDLLAGMTDHDVMIGSRYIPGGGISGEQFDLKRKAMSFGINSYARLVLGLRSRDNSGSFRCYRASKLAQIDLGAIRSRGYAFMEEILFLCRVVGCRIGESPILFENRRTGVTKLNKTEAARALRDIALLGVDRALGRSGVHAVHAPEPAAGR